MQVRQGDVYMITNNEAVVYGLVKTKDIPKRMKKVVSGIITHSDHTSHTHKLVGGTLFQGKDKQYISVGKKATVQHEEHKYLTLSKGKYIVIRQREFHTKDMSKIVVD